MAITFDVYVSLHILQCVHFTQVVFDMKVSNLNTIQIIQIYKFINEFKFELK